MYKKCIYNLDIQLDSLGVVQQCQCECAAGMGPEAHCKHVGLVLHALTKLKEGIITQETCTQVLQIFHQAKKIYWMTCKNGTSCTEKLKKSLDGPENF